MKIAWMPPSRKLIRHFFNREKGDKYDGLYSLVDRALLNVVNEVNASAGERYNFKYMPFSADNFAQDIEVPVNQFLVRMAIVVENVTFDLKKSRIILAYLPT